MKQEYDKIIIEKKNKVKYNDYFNNFYDIQIFIKSQICFGRSLCG